MGTTISTSVLCQPRLGRASSILRHARLQGEMLPQNNISCNKRMIKNSTQFCPAVCNTYIEVLEVHIVPYLSAPYSSSRDYF